nr:DNA cytosine methyltransferase [Mycoplasmopsis bovis]
MRKLTPRECFNFQGFPSSFKLPNIVKSQLYKQSRQFSCCACDKKNCMKKYLLNYLTNKRFE